MRMKKIVLLSLALGCTHLFSLSVVQDSYTPMNTVFVFDIDDVISIRLKAGLSDYMTLIPRIVWWNPRISAAVRPKNAAAIAEQGRLIAQKIEGGCNVIHALLEKLQEMGYGNLTSYEDDILERAIKMMPLMPMIAVLHDLKKQGFTLIGATNQDYKHHLIYRKKMKQSFNIDLGDIFAAVLTTQVNHDKRSIPDNVCADLVYPHHNIYVAAKEHARKPYTPYFIALDELIKQKAPHASTVVFTDDRLENVIGARALSYESIHFKLKGGTASKTNMRDLEKAVLTWKNTIYNNYYIKIF